MSLGCNSFAWAIVIYLIIFFVIVWAGCKSGMGLFSGLTLGALIAGIFLLFMVPPSEIERHIHRYCRGDERKEANDGFVVVYGVIMALTLILLVCYVVFKAYEDRARRLKIIPDNKVLEFDEYFAL